MTSIPIIKIYYWILGELLLIVEYCRFGNLQQFLINSRNNFINQVDESGQLKILDSVTDGKGFPIHG